MADKIIQVALHGLRRNDLGNFEIKIGKKKLKLSKTVVRVVTEIHGLYASKSAKAHGKFSEPIENYPAQTFIKNLKDNNYNNFSEITKKLMDTLAYQAKLKSGSTGGHVLFAHIEKDKQVYLLVAIITEKLGAALTNDLDIADIKHLDLSGFRFAGRVNITAWLAGADRYIGFLKGKGNVAEYFKEFLGCDTAVQDQEDTKTLIRILRDFSDPTNGIVKDKEKFLKKAFEICERHIRSGSPIDFEVFSNELFPENPNDLALALVQEQGLSDGFIPNDRVLKTLVKFRAKTQHWRIEFDRSALAQKKIVYNGEKKTILIRDLPADLIEELEREQE
ncbi:nucleoid-associated protein [Ochrobactrum chromiisoli]|uniref:Nucleoid-associated protein n=1 Tax=Ochrobactrum chromiisoli TaxID=2993941 RepID=A0ABT3QMX5_9HYPH|nr:nucleoid-associated protein [Ochrobactrum chromiisoli]MCX2696940.1 nucleoid-associated protein [Ochrobactrum chromiisoli]